MPAEDHGASWQRMWDERRRRCLEELAGLPASLSPGARAVVQEAERLATIDDPSVHAAAGIAGLRDRVDELEIGEAVLLHRPISNGMSLLQIAAQQLLAARAGAAALSPRPLPLPRPTPARQGSGFAWFLVISEDPELGALVSESKPAHAGRPVETADTLETALAALQAARLGRALVVVNLTLRSAAGRGLGTNGLDVAAEARRRRHAVLLVTGAGDYAHYWARLQEVGLTGHDLVIKTRRDFAERLRARIEELAEPATVKVSYDDDTGHVVWIGDVEVTNLEAQEALVLRALDDHWKTAAGISEVCSHTDIGPQPGNVPPLISTLRARLGDALMMTDSHLASRELIQSRRLDGPTQYRLAPWLEWDDPPEPVGAPAALPQILVVDDDPAWSDWVVGTLTELGWPASSATTVPEALAALQGDDTSILVIDLGLPDPAAGVAHPGVGIDLVEQLTERKPGLRVVVLTAYGQRDTIRSRLFEAGVRTIDIIDKASGRDECTALLLSSLERAADEIRRRVRRRQEPLPFHRVVRLERTRIEVDGHPIEPLSPREEAVLDVLIAHHNQPVTAEFLDDRCYSPRSGRASHSKDLNRVHQTFKRLRLKIDRNVGAHGVGASVLRTPHRGARTTYELHGLVMDLHSSSAAAGLESASGSDRQVVRSKPSGRLAPSAFLAYAVRDGASYAERLDRDLRQHGVETWLGVRDMDESLDFTGELEQAIRAADVFIACITEDVIRPESYVRREIAYAQLLRKRIAVARFQDVVPPISVVTNTFFEFHEDWDTHFARLLTFCRTGQPVSAPVR